MRYFRRFLLPTILFACAAALSLSQENRATVLGRITDPAGGSVAKATIRVTNIDTSVAATAQSDSAGNYSVPFLPPGAYELEVEATGVCQSYQPFGCSEWSANTAVRL